MGSIFTRTASESRLLRRRSRSIPIRTKLSSSSTSSITSAGSRREPIELRSGHVGRAASRVGVDASDDNGQRNLTPEKLEELDVEGILAFAERACPGCTLLREPAF